MISCCCEMGRSARSRRRSARVPVGAARVGQGFAPRGPGTALALDGLRSTRPAATRALRAGAAVPQGRAAPVSDRQRARERELRQSPGSLELPRGDPGGGADRHQRDHRAHPAPKYITRIVRLSPREDVPVVRLHERRGGAASVCLRRLAGEGAVRSRIPDLGADAARAHCRAASTERRRARRGCAEKGGGSDAADRIAEVLAEEQGRQWS
jgi:hypothetical protein